MTVLNTLQIESLENKEGAPELSSMGTTLPENLSEKLVTNDVFNLPTEQVEISTVPFKKQETGFTTQQIEKLESGIPIKDIAKPILTPEEAAIQEVADFSLSMNTGIPISEIRATRQVLDIPKPNKTFWKKANDVGNRFSDQLHNALISNTIQIWGARDSSAATDIAYQLLIEKEKREGFKLGDKLFDEQVADYAQQLYLPPEKRSSAELKNEPQLKLPEKIISIFDPRPVDEPEGWADTGVDVLSGIIDFVVKSETLQRAMPSVPAPMIWESVAVANGGKPLSGAAMYGTLKFVSSFFPGEGIIPKLGGGLGAGVVFGGTTAITGGNTKEILINFGLPTVLGYMSITRAEWASLKPRSKLDLITATKEFVPALKDTPIREIDTSINELLSPTSAKQASQRVLKPFGVSEELAPSQTSQKIIESAVLKQLLPEGEVDPKMHNVLKLKEAARIATETVLNDTARTERILSNREDAPEGTTPLAVLKAAKEKAYMDYENNPEAAIDKVLSLKDADVIEQGTAAGQLLVSLREQRKFDPVSTAADVVEARGTIPEPKLVKRLQKAQVKLTKVEEKLAKRENKIIVSEAKLGTERVVKVDITRPEFGSKNKIVTTEMANAAWKRLGEKGTLSAGIDPAKMLDVLEISTYYLEAIGRNLPEWTRILKEKFGEVITPHLDDLWKKANTALNKTERDSLVGRLQSRFEDGQSLPEQAKTIRNLEKNLVRSGNETREALLKEMHKILKGIDPAITERESMDAMSGSGKYKLLSRDEIEVKVRELNGQFQQVAKLQDMQNKIAPPKSGFERPIPSDEQRRLIQQVNEMKKKSEFIVTDPVRQLKSALDTAKTRLKNRISDLKEQIQSRQRIVKTKTPQPSDAETIRLTAEKNALQKEFDSIFGDRPITVAQRIKMATVALEKSIAELERRIKENDLTPAKKETTKLSTPKLEALRADKLALQEEIQTLKDIANPKKTPEEIALQSYKSKLANETKKFKKQLANEDFKIPEKKTKVLDKKAVTLREERDTAKRAVKAAQDVLEQKGGIARVEVDQLIKLSNKIEKTKLAFESETPLDKATIKQKSIDHGNALLDFSEYRNFLVPTEHTWQNLIIDVLAMPQSILTSIDFSFPFRQGWGSMATKEFWEGFGEQYKYAWSEKNFRTLMAEIEGSPRYKMARKARLGLTNLGQKLEQLGAREEAMQSTLTDKIPIVGRYIRASQRAYTGMADYIRWNRFNNMVDAYTLMKPEVKWDSKQGQKVAKDLAKVINMMTGRGNIWKDDEYGNTSVAVNQIFFSIRKWSADLNMLDPTNYIGWGKYSKLDPFVRSMAQRQLLGSLAMTTAILGLAKMSGADIETDPTSKQFGMIHIGNRYYDISGGKISMLVFFAQMALAESKDTDTGVKRDLSSYGLQITGAKYLRSKLAPGTSFIADVILRSDYMGKSVETPKEIALDAAKRFYPMTIGDTVKMLNDDTFGDVFANTLLNLTTIPFVVHGVGVQIHNDNYNDSIIDATKYEEE